MNACARLGGLGGTSLSSFVFQGLTSQPLLYLLSLSAARSPRVTVMSSWPR